MQAQRERNARRSLFLAAVLAAHALIIALLIHASSTVRLAEESAVSVSAVVLLPARRRPERFRPARLRPATVSAAPITAPITLVLPAVRQPIHAARPINWARAARQAVSTVLRQHPTVTMGFPAGARSRSGLHSTASGIRAQGRESYRTATGQHVARGSGDCYVVSGPPLLDATRLEQQAQMSRVECSGGARHGPSPDNLFKNLPAYKRYHTLPPLARHPKRRKTRHHPRPPGTG